MTDKILTRDELHALIQPMASVNGSSLSFCNVMEHDHALRELVRDLAEALDDARAQQEHVELVTRAKAVCDE